MRDYDDCLGSIHLYFDGEITGQELEQFRHHLIGCEACQTELKVITELSRLLYRSRPLYSAPNDLRSRLIYALQNHLL
jgi:anti-sigma factor (TIGR02949 family)